MCGNSRQRFAKGCIRIVASEPPAYCADCVPRVRAALAAVQLTSAFECQLASKFVERLLFRPLCREHEPVKVVQPHGVEATAAGPLRILGRRTRAKFIERDIK